MVFLVLLSLIGSQVPEFNNEFYGFFLEIFLKSDFHLRRVTRNTTLNFALVYLCSYLEGAREIGLLISLDKS